MTTAILALSGIVSAQPSSGGGEFRPGAYIGLQIVVAFLINGLLGGALVAVGPSYATQTVTEIRDDPGGAFVWGLLVGIGVPIVFLLLAITIIGLVVTIPGLIAVGIVGLIGHAVAIVWVGTLVSRGDRVGGKAAGLGALVLAVISAIPALGEFIITVVGYFGIGVVGRRLYVSREN
ncbi:hypothetical protein [Natrinema salinisoli]|uniref:hypothetical protein n=1 Tax=Natrinema salinisoli TaxID=2878535 RepID=UPI001CF069FC|nr:hypothetical protein [Natrinema salinisoli]